MANIGEIMSLVGGGLEELRAQNQRDAVARTGAEVFATMGPEAAPIAELLRRDPDAGLLFVQQAGGFDALHERLQSGQRRAAVNRFILSGLGAPGGAPTAAAGAPAAGAVAGGGGVTPPSPPSVQPPAAAPGRGVPVGEIRRPGAARYTSALREAAQAGVGPEALKAIQTIEDARASSVIRIDEELANFGITRSKFTGESIHRYIENLQQTGRRDLTLLKEVPKEGNYATFAVPDPTSPTGSKIVTMNLDQVKGLRTYLIDKRARGLPLSESEWAAWDMIVQTTPRNQLMRGALSGFEGLGAAPTSRGRPTTVEQQDAAEMFAAQNEGRLPTEDELRAYMTAQGWDVEGL